MRVHQTFVCDHKWWIVGRWCCSSSWLSGDHRKPDADMEDGSEGCRGHVDVLSVWSSGADDQLAQELRAGRRVGSKDLGPSVWYCSAVMFVWCAGERRREFSSIGGVQKFRGSECWLCSPVVRALDSWVTQWLRGVLSGNNLRQVVHAHVPLSPSSINWYRCKSLGVNMHTTRCTSPVAMVSQYKLVSGWGLWKQRSAPPYGPMWLGKDFTLWSTGSGWPRDPQHSDQVAGSAWSPQVTQVDTGGSGPRTPPPPPPLCERKICCNVDVWVSEQVLTCLRSLQRRVRREFSCTVTPRLHDTSLTTSLKTGCIV